MKHVLIPVTDPRCKEIQNGHSDYHDGLILADTHFTDTDDEWLVGPVESRIEYKYANVHYLHWLPKVDGKRVYGVRFWARRQRDWVTDENGHFGEET